MTTSLAGSKPSYKAILKENSFLWFGQRKGMQQIWVTSTTEYAVTATWPNFFCGFDLHQAKLPVFKATWNPTGDDGKSVSVEVWDRLLGFKVLPLLGRLLSPAHDTNSPQCKAPSTASWAACVRLCSFQSCCNIPACEVGTEMPTSASLPRRIVRVC